MAFEDFIVRLIVAMIAGTIIGLEREWRLRSAGLVTNTLVAVGAAIYVVASVVLTKETGDPSRVLGQIAAGVGFLGAGVIMRDGFNIHGINTAASIWCSAAIGALAGFNLIPEAFAAAILVVLINVIVRQEAVLVNKLSLRKKQLVAGKRVHLYMEESTEADFRVFLMETLQNYPMLTLRTFQSGRTGFFPSSKEFICEILFNKKHESDFNRFILEISKYHHLEKIYQEAIYINT